MADRTDTIRFRADGLGAQFDAALQRADVDASKVLRQFVRWYCGEPGAQLPQRPGTAPESSVEMVEMLQGSMDALTRGMDEPEAGGLHRALAELGDPPSHEERILLLPARVPDSTRLEYRRKVRDAHDASRPKFAPPEPLSPEDLSLRMYEMAVADGYMS